MRRVYLLIFSIFMLCLIAVALTGCRQETTVTVSDVIKIIPSPAPEKTAAPSATLEPWDGYYFAVEGYSYTETRKTKYNKKGVFWDETVQFFNLFSNRTFYVNPNNKSKLFLTETPSEWQLYQEENGFYKNAELGEHKGYLTITVSTPCYLNVENVVTGEKVTVYCVVKAEQKSENKQADSNIPYYLYLEKGSYDSYQKGTCVLMVYTVDSDGYYTVPYITMSAACGSTPNKTPTGYHTLDEKEAWHSWSSSKITLTSGFGAISKYVTKYKNGLYIHSVNYSNLDEVLMDGPDITFTQLQSGHVSGGCIRLLTGYAQWIYNNCVSGTTFEIVNDNPRCLRADYEWGTFWYNPDGTMSSTTDITNDYLLTLRRYYNE